MLNYLLFVAYPLSRINWETTYSVTPSAKLLGFELGGTQ